jgi:hypothetical protein
LLRTDYLGDRSGGNIMSAWEKTEIYTADGEAQLAEKLYETGLLYFVNAAVLHNFGMALAVDFDEDDNAIGIALNLTKDPNGIWFDEETTDLARQKMRKSGIAFNVNLEDDA